MCCCFFSFAAFNLPIVFARVVVFAVVTALVVILIAVAEAVATLQIVAPAVSSVAIAPGLFFLLLLLLLLLCSGCIGAALLVLALFPFGQRLCIGLPPPTLLLLLLLLFTLTLLLLLLFTAKVFMNSTHFGEFVVGVKRLQIEMFAVGELDL